MSAHTFNACGIGTVFMPYRLNPNANGAANSRAGLTDDTPLKANPTAPICCRACRRVQVMETLR